MYIDIVTFLKKCKNMHKIVYVNDIKMEKAYTQMIPLTQTGYYSQCVFEVLLSRVGNTQIRLYGVYVGR